MAKNVFKQVALGIKYLHERDIVHRDIKLENIMLSRKDEYCTAKISDFGLS